MFEGFKSTNPYTGKDEYFHQSTSIDELENKIKAAHNAQLKWKQKTFEERAVYFERLRQILLDLNEKYGKIVSQEMGKPITEAAGEIRKCATLCDFYSKNARPFLKDEHIETEFYKSMVTYEPMGVILGVMPWNFPFWQTIRFAVPTLMAGNAVLVKPAPNVFESAKALEHLFLEAGFPKDIFQTLYIHHSLTPLVLKEQVVKGVSFTGSVNGGRAVASQAAQYGKKSVLELGGSDPFIILEDANLSKAAKAVVISRFKNAGQTCISAKRLIILEAIADQVLPMIIDEINALTVGNPLNEGTNIGPMARPDLVDNLEEQVKKTVDLGAKVLIGGKRKKDTNFFELTILTDIPKGSPAYSEEIFGPVLSVFVVENEAEAIELANDTTFGLGASLWTNNLEKGEQLAREIQTGTVAVNSLVKSDARLPFGGINDSGYGKELSLQGIREFVNAKVIVIN